MLPTKMAGDDTDPPRTPGGAGSPPPRTSFAPLKPKFGNMSEVAKDSWVTWTGGKPKADWSGLEEPNPTTVEPNQHRSTSLGTQAKSQFYRVKGMETKFGKNSDLLVFQKDVMQHLKEHGLDTITYLPDPTKKDTLVSVITDHARFTIEDGAKTANKIREDHFDRSARSNEKDATRFVTNSVDMNLIQ